MKADIHPEYVEAVITCACGNSWSTRSTQAQMHVEVCSDCHPFFTGEQRIVDTAGRVERFRRRYAKAQPRDTAESGNDDSVDATAAAASQEPEQPAETAAP